MVCECISSHNDPTHMQQLIADIFKHTFLKAKYL